MKNHSGPSMVDTLEGDVVLKTFSELKLGRAAECKLVLKKQEDNCPHKWQRG